MYLIRSKCSDSLDMYYVVMYEVDFGNRIVYCIKGIDYLQTLR